MAAMGSPQYAALSPSSSGNNTIVSGVANYRIVVLGYVIVASGTVNLYFRDGTAGSALTGTMQLTAQAGVSAPVATPTEFFQGGHFQTSAGNALVINLSGGTEVDGHLTYMLVRET